MTVPTPNDEKYYPIKISDTLTVRCKRATEEQAAVIAKTAKAVERDPEGRAINGMDLLFRIFERMLAPEDVERVDFALVTGEMKLGDFAKLMVAGQDEETDDKPVPAKRVRRSG